MIFLHVGLSPARKLRRGDTINFFYEFGVGKLSHSLTAATCPLPTPNIQRIPKAYSRIFHLTSAITLMLRSHRVVLLRWVKIITRMKPSLSTSAHWAGIAAAC